MRARRALLYMPGDDRHKIEKALTLDVDCVCMDMEDGVALNRKAEARRTIAAALRKLGFGRSEKLARINAVGSGLETERGQQLTRVCAKVLQQDGSIAVAEPDLRGLGPDRTRSGDHPTWFVGHAPQ